MKRLVVIVTLTAIWLSARPCVSQSLLDYEYTPIEGLPSSEVYDIFQDSKGFIWFGTDNGVARFDGRDLEVYNINDGLSDPVVFGINEDRRGRIWFRTYSGNVSYYENGEFHAYQHNDQLRRFCKHAIMFSMHVDTLDRLWFAVGRHIGNIDAHGRLDTVAFRRGAIHIREVEDRPMYSYHGSIGQANSLLYKGHHYPIDTHENGPQYHVMCATRWKGKLYFSINNNVYLLDGERIKHVKTGKDNIIFLEPDEGENLWVGYLHRGAERFSDSFDKPTASLFGDRSVTNVLQDHEGGVWISTLESGVHYLPNLLIENTKSTSSEKITAVASDETKVVTASFGGELKAFDIATHELISAVNIGYPIIALTGMISGDYWLSHSSGSMILNNALSIKKEMSDSRLAFAEQPNGHILSASTHSITIFNPKGTILERRINEGIYRTLLVSDSLILMAGRSGLHVYNNNTRSLRIMPTFEKVKIRALGNLNDSLIFIGTLGNGFSILNKATGNISQFNVLNKFNSDKVYSFALEDSLLWIGTDKGIAMCSIGALERQSPNFKFLTKRTGLISDKVNFLLSTKNSLWVFSDEGTSDVPYTGIRFANSSPVFHLTQIRVNSKNTDSAPTLNLRHGENNILIKYKSISFNNSNIITRYRLQRNEPWVHSSGRELLFSSLAPGTYKFEMEYSIDNHTWKQALSPITITINPPWWNRWYSYVSGVLLLVGLGYMYFKYLRSIYRQKNHYLQIINDHQHKLLQSEIVTIERERNRISKELHDRVGTNLTAIKLMVSQLLKSHKDPTAPDVEEQFQVAIREIKEIIYGLTPPSLERYGLFTGLKNYIGKLNKSIPINISLKTFGNEINKYEMNIILFRVLQELITNSIKHSFAKDVTIHINSFEDILNIVYEDDGIGFSYDPSQGGLGLDSIESRINSLGGSLRFDSGEFGISYTIDIPINLNKEVV